MKAIMVMYDSLNRHMLEPYGCDWVKTPNFSRLASRAVTFDCNYVGSMPCMPARRELHTGRYGFLHRGWGPLEPFDDSMPEILKKNGIYSHLVSDHWHYWEDGGATYHNRYSSWECVRGQEGDPWKAAPRLIEGRKSDDFSEPICEQNWINRTYMDCEEKMPQAKTFRHGLEFLEKNWECDGWFLQIETFDPHEPFFSPESYKKLYPHAYEGPVRDWPPYYFVTEGEELVGHVRYEYAALVSMCDAYLGKVLDFMDEHDMWKDTLLIVNTDHGYLLGEHDWWSKTVMPVYEEISHTPLFVWNPRIGKAGSRCGALTQTIDLPATILEFFGIPLPEGMQGRPLSEAFGHEGAFRKYALFGYHEGHVNITDGQWVYMKAPVDSDAKYFKEYTLMPTHMCNRFSQEELQGASLHEPFSFTKGCPVLATAAQPPANDSANFGSRLYDLREDARQENPIIDMGREAILANAMLRLMEESDCPAEYYRRFGFEKGQTVTEEDVRHLRELEECDRLPEKLSSGHRWTRPGRNVYRTLAHYVPESALCEEMERIPKEETLDAKKLLSLIGRLVPEEEQEMVRYFAYLSSRCD